MKKSCALVCLLAISNVHTATRRIDPKDSHSPIQEILEPSQASSPVLKVEKLTSQAPQMGQSSVTQNALQVWKDWFTGLFIYDNPSPHPSETTSTQVPSVSQKAADEILDLQCQLDEAKKALQKAQSMGWLQRFAHRIEQGEYKQAAESVLEKVNAVAKKCITTIKENPKTTAAVCIGFAWTCVFFSIKRAESVLNKKSTVSGWLGDEITADEIEKLDKLSPGKITEELINYIYNNYRKSPRITSLDAEQQFIADLNKELEAAEAYIYWGETLPSIVKKAVFYDEDLFATLHDRIDRLIYYRRLFLQWTDARDAAASSAGTGMGGLSSLLG